MWRCLRFSFVPKPFSEVYSIFLVGVFCGIVSYLKGNLKVFSQICKNVIQKSGHLMYGGCWNHNKDYILQLTVFIVLVIIVVYNKQ